MDLDETEVPEVYIELDPPGAHGLCAIRELNTLLEIVRKYR